MAGLWDVPVWRKYRAKVKKFRKANPGPNTIGWKPIPRLGCRDGDRLEANSTVVVSRYLDCKFGN